MSVKKAAAAFLFFLAVISSYAEPERIILSGDGLLFSVNRSGGFSFSSDNGVSWIEKNEGLPEKVVYPFTKREIREITALSYDAESGTIILCGSDFIAVFDAAVSKWEQIPLKYPLKPSAYISAVAVSSSETGLDIVAGTTFSGIFRTRDMGASWEELPGTDIFVRGGGLKEEMTAAGFGSGAYSYYAATGENKLYGFSSETLKWEELFLPSEIAQKGIYAIIRSEGGVLIYSGNSVFESSPDASRWKKFDIALPYRRKAADPESLVRKEEASMKNGIYLNFTSGRPGNIEKHIDFIKKNGMNSFVIDLKDDFGNITCGTSNSMAAEAGAAKEYFKLKGLLEKAHAENIYVIGRMVIFKDEKLYKYGGNRYAVKNISDGGPWRHLVRTQDDEYIQKEFWVDPFCEDIWDYNIALAREFQDAGIDEIQFDYIRFPTDGDISKIKYDYKKKGMSKVDALESFLKKARESLEIPFSVDFYGFNGWYRMGNWNGQNLDIASKYADVVSPMFYPSHFPLNFHKKPLYLDWAEHIYEEGSKRAARIAGQNGCLIRPFVQAFLMRGELKFGKETYMKYLTNQIEGLNKSDASGFTLWNASNRYYMVPENFCSYIKDH